MKSTPFRFSAVAFLVLLTIASSSCLIVSKHSLIDPLKAKPDALLQGRWVGTDQLDDVYAVFDGRSALETNILGKGSSEKSELMFDVVTGPIGKYQYMSLKPRAESMGSEYLLARYSIEVDELKIWLLDSTLIDAAVSRGKLKGVKSGSSTTTLTDSPKRIASFIAANEGSDQLFEFLGTFRKAGK